MQRVKIVATLGPASANPRMIADMITAGLDVARLNFSHGTYEDHQKMYDTIRKAAKDADVHVAVLADLCGPKIRTGKMTGGGAELVKDREVTITTESLLGDAKRFSTTYQDLPTDVEKGTRVLLDDGLLELTVRHKRKDIITCDVINGGWLKENKGINLPGVAVSAPSLTAKDVRDVNFGIKMGVDYFALSFVRCADDVKKIKERIRKQGANTPVIAKIEKPEAVDNLDEILEISDGIMVARGDLGVELQPEQVPTIQTTILRASIRACKPVITATQMLETMSANPIPTRAEASDVANAIYDGTDAVMLSGETASGKYPVETVSMMSRIAAKTECSPFMDYHLNHQKRTDDPITRAVTQSAVKIVHELDATGILAFSVSGSTAKHISRNRPCKPVFAFSPDLNTCNRLTLVWGITPLYLPNITNVKRLIEASERTLANKKLVKNGELIVMVIGLGFKTGSTNMIKIHQIGQDD